jgi:hypothetical protein
MTTTATTTTTTKHSVTVGQFFYSSWGYDQTNVDFYKVVAVTPACVKVQQWTSRTVDGRVVPGDKAATWTDWSNVDQDADYWTQQDQKVERDAAVRVKRVRYYSGRALFFVTSYADAYEWDGTPKYDTHAAGQPGH